MKKITNKTSISDMKKVIKAKLESKKKGEFTRFFSSKDFTNWAEANKDKVEEIYNK